MSESAKNRRQKAAEARGAAASAEKRRERLVRIVGGATVVAVMAAIVGVALYASNQESSSNTAGGAIVDPDPNAALPVGVFGADEAVPFGVPYGTASADAPVLELWEDFQCPSCGALEIANGAGIEQLAEEGSVQLVYRPTAFLDSNLGNDASHRAIAAWGCAIDQGKVKEFHNQVFANQPTEEGTGYTDEQLLAFGAEAGITGDSLETFNQCLTDGTYLAWAANSTEQFYNNQIPGTPSGFLNGEIVGSEILADPQGLVDFVASKK